MSKMLFTLFIGMLALVPFGAVSAAPAEAPAAPVTAYSTDVYMGAMPANLADSAIGGVAMAMSAPGSGMLFATPAQSLTINLDTSQLFAGAQLMIDALSAPYLLLAGFGLGVSILGAIIVAVNRVRL